MAKFYRKNKTKAMLVLDLLMTVAIVAVIAVILGSCSPGKSFEPQIRILQVIWFDEPFTIYGNPMGPQRGNIAVMMYITMYGKLVPLTLFADGDMDDVKLLTGLVGKEMSEKSLKELGVFK